MIKEVIETTSETTTSKLAFKIPIGEAPKKIQEKFKGQDKVTYNKSVMLMNRGSHDKTVAAAKARFAKADGEHKMYIVKLSLPEGFDFKAKFGSQAERMEASYKVGYYGTCIVPAHWELQTAEAEA